MKYILVIVICLSFYSASSQVIDYAKIGGKVYPVVSLESVILNNTDYIVPDTFLSGILIALATENGVAASDTQLTLPTPSVTHLGKIINLCVFDTDATYDAVVTAGTDELWYGGTLATNALFANGDIITIICVQNPINSSYLWAIRN